MKFNQFAHVKVPFEQKLAELNRIAFLHAGDEDLASNHIYRLFLERAFPNFKTEAAKNHALSNLAATENTDILTYLNSSKINARVFYAVGLQLLGFEAELDFDLKDPFSAMDKLNLPYQKEINHRDDVINAWYDLLCTSTKKGQNLLDILANRGYFTQFYQLNLTEPIFFNGKAQPVFDTNKLIHEVVYVESELDTDQDGKRDLLKVIITRPAMTDNGMKVPTIFTASPYYLGTNDASAEKMMHSVDLPITRKEVKPLSYQDIEYHKPETKLPKKRPVVISTKNAEESWEHLFTYTFNDYMLARGFAVVYSGGVGTLDSDGYRTCGDEAETLGAKDVVEWLNGKRTAFTTKEANKAIPAWWSNGKVAMTGKSYLGTLATATATTGVEGLETIISEAAISSWYDYYREGGLVIAPGGFPGEDADILAEECFSRQKSAGDYNRAKDGFNKFLSTITKDQDRTTGNYNTFWDARNYLKDVGNIKCDIVMVHGLNDWNVKLKNVFNLYNKLGDVEVTKKLILHQGQHIYINNFQSLDFTDMMNLWLSHKLYGIENNAKELLPDILVQNNTKESTWETYSSWQSKNFTKLYLDSDSLSAQKKENQTLEFSDHLPEATFKHYQANINSWKEEILASTSPKLEANRLILTSKPLKHETLLKGVAKIKLKIASQLDHGLVSVKLVDYGDAKRLGATPTILERRGLDLGYHWQEDNLVEFKLTKETPFKMITQAHLNLQNRHNNFNADELEANKFYDVEITTQPMFYHLPKGHKLGLVIYATDMEMTLQGNEENSYRIDTTGSYCLLPIEE